MHVRNPPIFHAGVDACTVVADACPSVHSKLRCFHIAETRKLQYVPFRPSFVTGWSFRPRRRNQYGRHMGECSLQVLKSTAVRNYANGLAYKNPALATEDAMRVGRLHTFLPGEAVHASSHLAAVYLVHCKAHRRSCFSSRCKQQLPVPLASLRPSTDSRLAGAHAAVLRWLIVRASSLAISASTMLALCHPMHYPDENHSAEAAQRLLQITMSSACTDNQGTILALQMLLRATTARIES